MILFALGLITGLLIAHLRSPRLTREERAERRVQYVIDRAMEGWKREREAAGWL